MTDICLLPSQLPSRRHTFPLFYVPYEVVFKKITEIPMFDMEHIVYLTLKENTNIKKASIILGVLKFGGRGVLSPIICGWSPCILKKSVHDRQYADYITYWYFINANTNDHCVIGSMHICMNKNVYSRSFMWKNNFKHLYISSLKREIFNSS